MLGRYNLRDMKLESNGILISMWPMGERDSVARVFTPDFGVLCGVMRAAQIAKKNRPLVGQIGAVAWNARLDSQLGTFHWESVRNMAAPLMTDAMRLMHMNAAFDLMAILLPEREKYENLYHETLTLLGALAGNNPNLAYLDWEIVLLRELGYALNLSRCSGCGGTDNLEYLSPRTGRAVCTVCAAPYINKLYKLPVTDDVTFRFLSGICDNQGAQMPTSRQMLKSCD